MNGDHLYNAGDVLILALLDSNNDGVPNAGDTVIADQYPLDCTASSFGNFGVTSLAVTSGQVTSGRVAADAGGATFTWAPVGAAENGPGDENVGWWNTGQIGFNHILQDDTTATQPSDAIFVPAENNVLAPDVPTELAVYCFDGTNNSFFDVQLNPS